jgi:hypothetical protein
LPCALSPKFGFGRVWSGDADIRADLGCPVEEERPVTVRQREYVSPNQYCGQARSIWPDAPTLSEFYELCSRGLLEHFDKFFAQSRLPDVPEQVIQGRIQSFESGVMLFVSQPDGQRSILVLPRWSRWHEFPDQ